MNNRKLMLLFAAAACAVGGMARADWNVGDPYKMHYPQLPDLTPNGLDVNATHWGGAGTDPRFRKILADDFRCSESGPINDIHLWGSWMNDQVYTGAQFKLSIHEDIPESPTGSSYSRPGVELWRHIFTPTTYVARPYATGFERFYDPNTNAIIGEDHEIWQYNFTHIPNPFVQELGKIYWLDVQVLTQPGTAWGWKTTNPLVTQHFMDDAVYGDTDFFAGPPIPQFPDPGSPLPTPWRDLHYPDGPFQGQSMDLAFVITPEPISLAGFAIAGMLFLRRR